MPIPEAPLARTKGLPSRFRSDDATLVRRVQGSDEAAFETIFKRHHGPLLSYCRHMLGSREEAEDALQQAFFKAHEALRGGSAPRELRPWLYAIARNCCLSAIAARRPTATLEDRTPALGGLSEEVHQREDLRELVAGIGRLPEDQRSALLLAELDDLDHRAIATIVGCEVSKVKALIYQARSALIADRDARSASCGDIREQLAVAHGGELRRGPLRRHLKLCEGCHHFQLAVSAQRQSLAAVLPVLPSAGFAAAILGHGGTHAIAAAGAGHVGAAGFAPTAGGAGAGAVAGGGAGVAATGAAATTAATTAAVGAGAGAGGTSVGALIGGGLVTKLAIGGAAVALAATGAETVHSRIAQATPHRAVGATLAPVRPTRRAATTDSSDVPGGPSVALTTGSPTVGLAAANWSTPGASAGSASLAVPSLLSAPVPILSSSALMLSIAAPSIAGAPVAKPGQSTPGPQSTRGPASPRGTGTPRWARRVTELRRRRALALRRRRAVVRHRARVRRRHPARRARLQKASLRRQSTVTPPAANPLVTPVPFRTHHRKAAPAPAPAPSTPARSTGSPAREGAGNGTTGHRRTASGTGTSSGQGNKPNETGTATSTPETGAGSGATGTGTGARKNGSQSGSKEVAEQSGSGATRGSGPPNAEQPGESTPGKSTSGSTPGKARSGGGESSGAGNGSTSGTGSAGKPAGPPTAKREPSRAGATGSEGTTRGPEKHLVEEEQLPNL